MAIVGYHIFINLLVNHIKNSIVKYRQFILIFALVKTVIFSTIYINFCSIQNSYFVHNFFHAKK